MNRRARAADAVLCPAPLDLGLLEPTNNETSRQGKIRPWPHPPSSSLFHVKTGRESCLKRQGELGPWSFSPSNSSSQVLGPASAQHSRECSVWRSVDLPLLSAHSLCCRRGQERSDRPRSRQDCVQAGGRLVRGGMGATRSSGEAASVHIGVRRMPLSSDALATFRRTAPRSAIGAPLCITECSS